MQLFRDTTAKKKESQRLKFTKVSTGLPFKGSVARLMTALVLGPPLALDADPDQCSHLCHNDPQLCFNPYHACWEFDSNNKSRNGCANGKSDLANAAAIRSRKTPWYLSDGGPNPRSAPQKVIDLTKLPSKRVFETRTTWTLTENYVSGPF